MEYKAYFLTLAVLLGVFRKTTGHEGMLYGGKTAFDENIASSLLGGKLSVQDLTEKLKESHLDFKVKDVFVDLLKHKALLDFLPQALEGTLSIESKDEIIKAFSTILKDNSSLVNEGLHSLPHPDMKQILKQILEFMKKEDIDISSLDFDQMEGLPDWVIDMILDYISENYDEIMETITLHINDLLDGLLNDYYLPVGNDIDEQCSRTTEEFFDYIGGNETDILEMIDSWGKLPDGFLFGNLISLGSYEECVQSETRYFRNDSSLVHYTGRYCKVTYRLLDDETSNATLDITGVLSLAHGLFGYGTCIPSICKAQDLWISLNQTLSERGLKVADIECQAKESSGSTNLSSMDRGMVSLISIFLFIVVAGTILDVTTRSSKETPMRQGMGKCLIGFSFWLNLEQVFTYDVKPGKDSITCLHALRVITLTWIVICHQYLVDMSFIINFFDATKYQDPVPGQIVTNGWLAGDTFLCLTGIVLAYRLLPGIQMAKTIHSLSIFAGAFVRRFFRLSPSILFVSLFSASLLKYLAVGPISYKLDQFSDQCRDYWWKDTLFINNYGAEESDEPIFKDCLSSCWYTAVDMQLFLIIPFLLLPVAFNWIFGFVIWCVVFFGSILIPMIITIVNDLPPSPIHLMTLEEHFEYNWRVYMAPWCRAGPWVVGVGTGILLRHPKIVNVKMHKLGVFCGYVIAIVIGLVLVMAMFPFNHVMPDKDFREYPTVNAAYGSLARPIWGLCVAFVVFCCHSRNSEVVNRILSYPGWKPLSRLSYTMFLIAPVVQKWWFASRLTLDYYNYLEKLFQSLGILFITGLIAIGLSCFVERPICNIINMMLPSPAMKHEKSMELLMRLDPLKEELIPVYPPQVTNLSHMPVLKLPKIQLDKVVPLKSSPFGNAPEVPSTAAYDNPTSRPREAF